MTEYGGRGVTRLGPDQVRSARFDPAPRRQVGLDPGQVYAFLAMVADELGYLHRDLVAVQAENERIKQSLRDWQRRHAGCGVSPVAEAITGTVSGRAPAPNSCRCGREGG